MKKTKIICSIGPSSVNPLIMEQMVNKGMNVARINFSHATIAEREEVVKSVKKVREKTGKHIAILYDTKGPEFRNLEMEENTRLIEDEKIRIVKENVLGNKERFSVNHSNVLNDLKVNDIILLENGLMKIKVESIEADGVTCIVVSGGILGSRKSLNVPGVNLSIPFISDNDYNDLVYAAKNDADFVALSFVSRKEDVEEAKRILYQNSKNNIKILAKIENQEGIDNLDEILQVADGIMVARGDLGVEVSLESLPLYQKNIISKCREYGKIAIVATEMLESMKKNIRPTRAEVSDVANAVFDGADAVMLSGETTTGKYPIEVVEYMSKICKSAEDDYKYESNINISKNDITMTIAKSVVDSTKVLDVKAIVAATLTGSSAIRLSNLRPNTTIIATCPSEQVARSLSLNWAVNSKVVKEYDSTDEIINDAKKVSMEMLNLQSDDIIIITGGFPNNIENKTTNFIKIEKIKK